MRLRSFLCSAILLICVRVAAEAHQPHLVTSNTTEVTGPEVSQAFYAKMNGKPQTYLIRAKSPFHLYVQLTIPDCNGARYDFNVEVAQGKKIIGKLEGGTANWKRFYEPFGGDHYLIGPDYDQANCKSGDYTIEVSNLGNTGKYVMVFGKKEVFRLGDMIRAIKVMPKVKKFMASSPNPAESRR